MGRPDDKQLEALRQMAAEAPVELRTVGGCMSPLIEDGQRLLVAPRRAYWPGDVIVFRALDGLRAHRFIGWVPSRSGLRWVMQSDAAADGAGGHDTPVPIDQVIGRVVGGACRREAYRVPPRHRLRALFRFVEQVTRSLRRRLGGGPGRR